MTCVSLVTGGTRGIGRTIVDRLADRGDDVFVFDIVAENEAPVQRLLAKNIGYAVVDVSNQQSVEKGFENVDTFCAERGGEGLGVLVNNAGITRDGLAIRLSKSDWDAVLDINLTGTFLCSQQALKRMIKQRSGCIVNLSSVVGLYGNPGQVNYAASKAGVVALTKSLAHEYGKRSIRVNAIAPGFIQTTMTEKLGKKSQEAALERITLGRVGTPHDVADVVAFLVSDAARYVTGQVIEVSGGMR